MRPVSRGVALLIALGCLTWAPAAVAQAPDQKPMSLKKLSKEELDSYLNRRKSRAAIAAPENVGEVPAEAKRTEDGVAYIVMKPGDGENRPEGNDVIAFHYTGWLQDGRMFDTSRQGRSARTVQVNRAANGLDKLFMEMTAGEERRVWVPEDLADAYRDPTIDGHVVFDLNLIDVYRAPPPPERTDRAPEDSTKTASGLAYKILEEGRGTAKPTSDSIVLVHMNAWETDGRMTLSTSRGADQPQSFIVGDMLEGFQEAVKDMRVGEKRVVWLPAHLTRMEGISEEYQQPQVVEFELLTFLQEPKSPPSDLTSPPATAVTTDTGLRYTVMRPGESDDKPKENDMVVVHYSAWTESGELVDTSFERGKPIGMALDDKLPLGIHEVLSTMTVGEQRRVWIPSELGFKDGKRIPQGNIVFELDLVTIR